MVQVGDGGRDGGHAVLVWFASDPPSLGRLAGSVRVATLVPSVARESLAKLLIGRRKIGEVRVRDILCVTVYLRV